MSLVRNRKYCGREDSTAAKDMNKTKKMCKDAGMTQKMFSDFLGIPVGTPAI
jgi:hypothetical protein